MPAVDVRSLPKVYITIKNEIIPPLPSGPGVLGVFGKTDIQIKKVFSKDIMKGNFSSLSEFLSFFGKSLEDKKKKLEQIEDKIKKSNNPQKPEKELADEKTNLEKEIKEMEPELAKLPSDDLIKTIKEAFSNGIPKLCCMLYSTAPASIETELDTFMGLYSDVDIMIILTGAEDKEKILAYIKKTTNNATPCLGLLGVDFDHDNSNKHEDLVLVAPKEALGAVAGLIGSLPYYESPTFKSLNFSYAEPFAPSKIDTILKESILPVSKLSGKGWVVCKGITSKDHEEISVRRIVHYAVRGAKLIADKFIGQLNTADGRSALRQKLIEFFTTMQKDNAIVAMENPESKKMEPAFMVEVTSTPSDFSMGIVRVALQIRPVRAMNYIDIVLNVRAT